MPPQTDFALAYLDSLPDLTLLLIHGFPLNSQMWWPQLKGLSGQTRMIVPDLRGHGGSEAVRGPYNMALLADDCLSLLDSLGITEPVVVGGLSMGGYVAFEIVRRYPERVAALLLTATRASADSEQGQAVRDKTIAGIRAQGVGPLAAGMLPRLLSPTTYENDRQLVEFVMQMMESTSLTGAIGALEAMRDRPDSTPMLSTIQIPTLIIHGADDELVPLSEAQAMQAAIPDARLVVLPNAGHLPNLEQPDAFNAALGEFLASL